MTDSGDNVTDTQATTDRKPYKDVDGNEIDAPVIASYEQELQAAANSSDVNAIAEIQERYHNARDKKVKADNDAETKRRKENK